MKFNTTVINVGTNGGSFTGLPISSNCFSKKQDPKRSNFPECANCSLEIKDRLYTKILDRCWHNSCFICCACKTRLDTKCFSRDGFIFCQADFQSQAWSVCSGCNKSILPDELVQRIHDYIFHVSCLTCSVCESHLQTGDKIFIVHGYPCKVYCHNDYKQHVIAKNSSESAKVVSAGGQWMAPVHLSYSHNFHPSGNGFIQQPNSAAVNRQENAAGVFRPTPLPAQPRHHQAMSPGSARQPTATTSTFVPSPAFPCQPIAQHPPNFKQQPNGHPAQSRMCKEEQAMSPSHRNARSPSLAMGSPGDVGNVQQQQGAGYVNGNTSFFQGTSMQPSPAVSIQNTDRNHNMDSNMDFSQSPHPIQPSVNSSFVPRPQPTLQPVQQQALPSRGTSNSSAFSPCSPHVTSSSVVSAATAQQRYLPPPPVATQTNGSATSSPVISKPLSNLCDDEKSSDNLSVSSENDLQCSPKSGASMGSSSGGTNSNPNSVSSTSANTPPSASVATPKRGPGNHLKGAQAEYLRSYYANNQKPSKEERDSIASHIGVEAKTVATWFQNRRSKEKIRREKAAAAAAALDSSGANGSVNELSQSSESMSSKTLSPNSNPPPPNSAEVANHAIMDQSSADTARVQHHAPVFGQDNLLSQSVANEVVPSSPSLNSFADNSSGYGSFVKEAATTNDFNMNAQTVISNNGNYHPNFAYAKPEDNQYVVQQEPIFETHPSGAPNLEVHPGTQYYVTEVQPGQYQAVSMDNGNPGEPFSVVQSQTSAFKSFQAPQHQQNSLVQPQYTPIEFHQQGDTSSSTLIPVQLVHSGQSKGEPVS